MFKNKKSLLILTLACATIIGLAIFLYPNESKNDTATNYNKYQKEAESLNGVITESDVIVMGKVVGYEKFDEYTNRYSFQINESVKGIIENKTIDVYEAKNLLADNNEYLLFLSSFDSSAYPSTVYTSIHKDLIVPINHSKYKIEKNAFLEKENIKDLKELMVTIKKADKDMTKKIKHKVVDAYSSKEKLSEHSEVIITAKILEIEKVNKYTDAIKFDLVEVQKGTFSDVDMLYISESAEIGKTYKLYLTQNDYDELELTTRKGSIVEVK